MSSFQDLLTRVSILTEAKASPYTASHPSFGGITSKMKAGGLSSAPLDTIKFIREVLYFLDIIDDSELNAIKNGAGFTGKKQAMLNVLKQKQELINAKSDEIAARISDTLDDFIGGVGVNRGREEKYAARAVAQEMAKQVRQTRTGKEMDDALTDLIADDSLIVRASVAKILSEIQTNLGEPGFDIDDAALAEVMDFAPKINSVEKLKSFVKQIGSLPGYEKIAAYLSAAVKPIVQGKEDEEMVEDEEMSEGKEQMEEAEEWTPERLNKIGVATPKYAGGKVPKFSGSEVSGASSEPVTEGSVLRYMSEQKVYTSPKPIVESISFKQKFAPKTSFQLEELRRYGL